MGRQEQLDQVLLEFGQGLKHSKKYHEDAVKLVDGVFRKLQEKLKNFKITEVHPAGSFGKKLDVLQPDLDLVVIVHFENPRAYETLREKVLDQFHDILYFHAKELRVPSKTIEKTGNIIAFNFDNGIEVDLQVAADLTKNQVYDEISKNPKEKVNFFSPCLIKISLDFMRAQDSFAHSLVRVLRFWYKLTHINIYGGKLMIDLIGVAAAMKQQESQSMLRGLSTAFKMISNLDTLKLAFIEEERGKWRQVTERDLLINSPLLVQRRVIGSHEILRRKGFVIDPSNPFNDLLANVKDTPMRNLRMYASEMGDRFAKALNFNLEFVNYSHSNNTCHLDIFKLFNPKPSYLIRTFPELRRPDFYSIRSNIPVNSPFPDMKVWNETRYQNKEIQFFIKAFQWDLLARVNSVQCKLGNDANTQTVCEETKTSAEEMIEELSGRKLAPSTQSHRDEDYDVTIMVPYEVANIYYAVKVSMRWK